MTKKLLLAVIAAATLLSGCSGLQLAEERNNRWHDDWSRARNIASKFDIELRDAKLPEGVSLSNDGSMLLSTAVGTYAWSGSLRTAGLHGGLPGTTSLGKSIGIGLGLSILESGLQAPDPIKFNMALGYVADREIGSAYSNPDERFHKAREIFVERTGDAIKKMVADSYPNAMIRDTTLRPNRRGYFIRYISVIDPDLGCSGYGDEATNPKSGCSISIHAERGRTKEPTYSSAVFGDPYPSYRFVGKWDTNAIVFDTTAKKINWVEILAKGAKHLPKDTFIFLTANPLPQGGKNPPMVLETDRINFFVKPEKPTSPAL